MSRVRLLAAISLIVALAIALVVVLVQQRSSDVPHRVASAASESAQWVTAPPPEPVAVPTPDNTGRDFDHIWREIQRFDDWAYMNPEVGLRHIHLIYHPECACYAALQTNLSNLLQDGVHFEDLVTRVESVSVTSDLGEAVRIETRMSIARRRLVDAQGITVHSDEGVPSRGFAADLELQTNGQWLARTIEIVDS